MMKLKDKKLTIGSWTYLSSDDEWTPPYDTWDIVYMCTDLTMYLNRTKKPQHDEIKSILRKYNVKNGKWFVCVKAENFKKVLINLCNRQQNDEIGDFKYIDQPKTCPLCVYLHDMDNLEEIRRVEKVLRECGINETMYWKPDAFTHAGIYSGHKKIKPYLYKSEISGNFVFI